MDPPPPPLSWLGKRSRARWHVFSWNIYLYNYCPVNFGQVTFGPATDRQNVMHMSPPCISTPDVHHHTKFGDPNLNGSWDMNYCPVNFGQVTFGPATDRRNVMHMSPPCISTGVLKKEVLINPLLWYNLAFIPVNKAWQVLELSFSKWFPSGHRVGWAWPKTLLHDLDYWLMISVELCHTKTGLKIFDI